MAPHGPVIGDRLLKSGDALDERGKLEIIRSLPEPLFN